MPDTKALQTQNDVLLSFFCFVFFSFVKYKHKGDDQTRNRIVCLHLLCALSFKPSISPFRILLHQCTFSSFPPKTTTWVSLSTSVHKTDAILMLWILKNAQFDKHGTETAEVGLLGNKVCPALVMCWHILSQGHFSSVIPNWQWAQVEILTVVFL